MPYYDRDEQTLYLLHSSVRLRVPVQFDVHQFRIAIGSACPRHRTILRNRLGNLDCRLSRGRWHWWTPPLWGQTWRPEQDCQRCGATVGPPLDPNLVPFLERADRRKTA
jgi:hypothetical protein